MSVERQHHQSQLFTVRLWIEPYSRCGVEVRGRAQSVLTGEVIYFRTWTALLTFFETALVTACPPPTPDDDSGGAPDNE
ncbi:MAG: hypothetical protein R3E79_07100 [Caldilineaceae bacterium]